MAKTFSAPLFVGVKLHLPPRSDFVAPLPVISDQSLRPLQLPNGLTYLTAASYEDTDSCHSE